MSTIKLPDATRKRLVQLLNILKNCTAPKITSVDISASSGWKSSLIRHDLWLIGFKKGISNGYNVQELKEAVENVLEIESPDISNPNNSKDAVSLLADCDYVGAARYNVCITGLGRLGAALLDNNLVYDSPFVIKAGFDSNLNRVEILRSTFPLYPASEMDFVIKREKIKYAILTVADKDAQNMAERLVKAGIKGIINMTNVVLKVPGGIKVENLSILNALRFII